ncbi:unnamed protein product [Schistosoma rodhaini]|nr:unnamed protein product [Schistosoma rodhaini]
MVRLTQKRARKSPSSSDINSGLTYTPCSATPVAPDNSGSGLIPHMLLDDSMSNLIMSSNSRTDGIDLIKSELKGQWYCFTLSLIHCFDRKLRIKTTVYTLIEFISVNVTLYLCVLILLLCTYCIKAFLVD